MKAKSDRLFLLSAVLLIVAGFFVFMSASLGLLAREGASFTTVALKQAGIAIAGIIVMVVASNINFRIYRKLAIVIFILALFITSLVFVPHIGFSHGGAARWISVGSITFQPAEILKIAAVIFLAALYSKNKARSDHAIKNLIFFLLAIGLVGIIMLKQPDNGTFLVIFGSLLSIYIISGAKFFHIAGILLLCVLSISVLAFYRPYVAARLITFINPTSDAQGSGYQVQQALIAVGSGGIGGRGFGQSVQKFSFLPEPIGDSIFAVAAEEFGFIGSVMLILIFVFFTLRGLKIAKNSKDNFGKLLAVGIVMLISVQAFINIAAIIGVIPLTGIPLSFVSHGGTALMFTMAETGIILNISKNSGRQKE